MSLTSSVPLEVAQGQRSRASFPAADCFRPAREAVSPANIFLPRSARSGGVFELRRCGAPPGVVGRGSSGPGRRRGCPAASFRTSVSRVRRFQNPRSAPSRRSKRCFSGRFRGGTCFGRVRRGAQPSSTPAEARGLQSLGSRRRWPAGWCPSRIQRRTGRPTPRSSGRPARFQV